MSSYFKLPELVTLAEGFLKFVKDPKQSYYEHVIRKLEDAIIRVNHILTIYPKPNDNFAFLFPQSIELHYVFLEITDISNQREINMLMSSVRDLALKTDIANDQWN